MARSWAHSWSVWDPTLRKLHNLDAGEFRMLSWPKGSPGVKVRAREETVFNTVSEVFMLLSGCKPGRKHLRLCSPAQRWRGKITDTHINMHVDLESNLCPPGQLLDSKVPSPWHGQVSPPAWNLVSVTELQGLVCRTSMYSQRTQTCSQGRKYLQPQTMQRDAFPRPRTHRCTFVPVLAQGPNTQW